MSYDKSELRERSLEGLAAAGDLEPQFIVLPPEVKERMDRAVDGARQFQERMQQLRHHAGISAEQLPGLQAAAAEAAAHHRSSKGNVTARRKMRKQQKAARRRNR